MAEEIVIAELNIDSSALVQSTAAIQRQIDSLKESQKQLDKSTEAGSVQFVKNQAAIKGLNTELRNNQKALVANISVTQDATVRQEMLDQVLGKEVTTIAEAREQTRLLTQLRNETNVTTEEGVALNARLNEQLDRNTEFVRENGDSYLQQRLNIGNYADSLKEAFGDLNIFNGGLVGFITRAQSAGGVTQLLTKSLGAARTAIIGMTRATLAFLATPIGAILAVVGTVLALVINYLKSTQAGIDAVTSVTRPLVAVFQALIGVVQQVGRFLIDAFTNPREALNDIYTFVRDTLIQQLNSLLDIIVGIATLDFTRAQQGFESLSNEIVKNVNTVVGVVGDAAAATAKFFGDALAAGAEIDRLTKAIEASEINLNKERAIATTRIKELEAITRNTAETTERRLAANEEQNRIAKELAATDLGILENRIALLKVQQSLNDTSREGLKELADLEAQREVIRQRVLDEELRGIRVIAQARKEAQAAAQAAVQERIDAQVQELALLRETLRFSTDDIENQKR